MANDEGTIKKSAIVDSSNSNDGGDGGVGFDICNSGGNARVGVDSGFSVIPNADARLLEHILTCYVAWHAEMSYYERISDAEKMIMAPVMDAANLMVIKLGTYGSTNQ